MASEELIQAVFKSFSKDRGLIKEATEALIYAAAINGVVLTNAERERIVVALMPLDPSADGAEPIIQCLHAGCGEATLGP